MKSHYGQPGLATMSKRRRGFQFRDPRQAWWAHPRRREGTAGEARPQRPLPLRFGQKVSSAAAWRHGASSTASTARA